MYMIAKYLTTIRWWHVMSDMIRLEDRIDLRGEPADYDELDRLEREHERLSRILRIPDIPF